MDWCPHKRGPSLREIGDRLRRLLPGLRLRLGIANHRRRFLGPTGNGGGGLGQLSGWNVQDLRDGLRTALRGWQKLHHLRRSRRAHLRLFAPLQQRHRLHGNALFKMRDRIRKRYLHRADPRLHEPVVRGTG